MTSSSASDEGECLSAVLFPPMPCSAPILQTLVLFRIRICPGRHFAAASLFIYCASVLHVFDIMPPKDENGNPVAMEYRPKDDLVSYVHIDSELNIILTRIW